MSQNHDGALEGSSKPNFPSNWMIAPDFDPNDHLMNLKGRDYLNVQSRLLWFIRDQRALIAAGLAREPYVVRTELIELDREVGWAHFKTVARDVLGNESVMYGSESAKDFADYIEKASTKSLGRALLGLGYGTAFAPEMDEGDRVVDAPVDRRSASQRRAGAPSTAASTAPRRQSVIREAPVQEPAAVERGGAVTGVTGDEPAATEQQQVSIRKLCEALRRPEPEGELTYAQARQLITQLSGEYQRMRRAS
ncbi:MAG TPA: hypothetical protein VE338_17895 [Ktedonobacterales bacterium]|nr:hypothetical protein [Ktedonobacterales bacterium]